MSIEEHKGTNNDQIIIERKLYQDKGKIGFRISGLDLFAEIDS